VTQLEFREHDIRQVRRVAALSPAVAIDDQVGDLGESPTHSQIKGPTDRSPLCNNAARRLSEGKPTPLEVRTTSK